MAQKKSKSKKAQSKNAKIQFGGQNPTSQDVANLANVSRATVSYVLNNTPGIKITEETKKQVLDAAAQLGYIPNHLASSLRSGQNNLVILPFFNWPYNQGSIAFLQELAARLDLLGYTVLLRFLRENNKENFIRKIGSFHPSGIIFYSETISQADADLLTRNGVQSLLFFGQSSNSDIPAIWQDFSDIGRCVGNYLVNKGYKHIAAVVPKDNRILKMGLERFNGLKQVCEENNVKLERIDLDYDKEEAIKITKLWKKNPKPDAIFTYNDEYGMMLLSALRDSDLSVPSDIALVGCDDLPLCEMLSPCLTSVRFSHTSPADSIATYFDSLLRGKEVETPLQIPIECEIIERESSCFDYTAKKNPGRDTNPG
ncbi:MAG: LacI family DNA-binding transcriptional regulator [Anaerolineales bacterium]